MLIHTTAATSTICGIFGSIENESQAFDVFGISFILSTVFRG